MCEIWNLKKYIMINVYTPEDIDDGHKGNIRNAMMVRLHLDKQKSKGDKYESYC